MSRKNVSDGWRSGYFLENEGKESGILYITANLWLRTDAIATVADRRASEGRNIVIPTHRARSKMSMDGVCESPVSQSSNECMFVVVYQHLPVWPLLLVGPLTLSSTIRK